MDIQLKEIYRLARPFLVVQDASKEYGLPAAKLLAMLTEERRNNHTDIIRVIRGHKSHTKYEFANEVSAAYQFPFDFTGRSWDALDEFMNDLDWLPPTDKYLLIILNADQLLLDEPLKDFEILMNILKGTSNNWEQGINHDILVRAYQEEVVPKTSRFAVVLQQSPDAPLDNNYGSWLKAANPSILTI